MIVVSADATPGQRERLRAAGPETYLTKPIEVNRLLALLDPAHIDASAGRVAWHS